MQFFLCTQCRSGDFRALSWNISRGSGLGVGTALEKKYVVAAGPYCTEGSRGPKFECVCFKVRVYWGIT